MPQLTEKWRVKDFIGISRSDTLHNDKILGMILNVSDEIVNLTARTFEKGQKVEYYPSYQQTLTDAVPIYVKLDRWPIDPTAELTIIYSPYGRHNIIGRTLTTQDYTVDNDKGIITIRSASGALSQMLLITPAIFIYAPDGFQVTYTAGYDVLSQVSSPPDPMDEDGLVQVPVGLRTLIARKIADDWLNNKASGQLTGPGVITPWSSEQMQQIRAYRR